MGFFYYDDSKHPSAGFALGALVYLCEDPTEAIRAILLQHGLDPSLHEFKSSAHMGRHPAQSAIRTSLRAFVAKEAWLAVAVVPCEAELGPAGLRLLHGLVASDRVGKGPHSVYFDEGMFRDVRGARALANGLGLGSDIALQAEQSSVAVPGIQLADLVAHTFSVMLRETLGHLTKKVVLSDDSYDGVEVAIGFEMWAPFRYNFFTGEPVDPEDPAVVSAAQGLFISENAGNVLREAALKRFGSTYLGCIH